MKAGANVLALAAVGSIAGALAGPSLTAGPREDLQQSQAAAHVADTRARQLETAAASAQAQSEHARAASVAVAARIQATEADIAATEARIVVVEDLRRAQRARLAEKQGPTIRLVAALQSLSIRPTALALAQPGSIVDLVHVHAVLAAIMPALRARTAGLRADIERGRALQRAFDAALAARRVSQQQLIGEQRRLVALQTARRMASVAYASSAMTEQDRAIAMGEQVRDIGELMTRLDTVAQVHERLAALPGPLLRPQAGSPTVAADAVPAAAIPAYRLPVVGQIVTGMGEVSATGVRARGLTIATRPGAQVVAPTSGRVAFAGPFRGYADIVVLDHGLGWTTLITGLAMLDVKTGDDLDRGAPVGRAGVDHPTVTIELRRRGQPVDIAKIAG